MILTAAQERALKAHLKYWRDRELKAQKEYILSDDELADRINRRYAFLYSEINDRINAFYSKYASAEGIDMATAMQKVSQMDVQAYQEQARQYVEAAARMRALEAEGRYAEAEELRKYVFSKEANQQLKLYNATMKINRLEMLKSQIGLDSVAVFNEIQQEFGDALDERTRAEFERQAGILGEGITETDSKVKSIVNASFNNATWSERLWMYQDELRADLSNLLTNGIIQGRNPRELARELQKYLIDQKQGVRANTERLLRTEMARVQTAAQEQAYIESGFEYYMFMALDTACPICAALDGNVYPISDLENNQYAPPIHPNCRCSTAAYVGE